MASERSGGEGEQAWEALVQRTRAMLSAVAAAGGTITYGELADVLTVRLEGEGDHSLPALLRAASEEEDEAGAGLVSAVVVRRNSGMPGPGWFRLAAERGRDVSDPRQAWEAERARLRRALNE